MSEKMKQKPFFQLTRINKVFGHTKALQGMDLNVYAGEIIGLVGPNGAGKSTLMKVITGVYPPTSGSMAFGDEIVKSGYNANDAKAHGIACAYQELSLCSNLSVYENFMVNHMNHKVFGTPGWRKKAIKETKEYLAQAFPNNNIDVNKKVSDLSLVQRQMVEIARAMSYKGLKVLVLDEPTSSLTSNRIHQLHDSMRALAKKGVAVIYISHKLDEIDCVCDRVVVMKGGTCAWEGVIADTSIHDLVEILGGEVKVGHKRIACSADSLIVADIKNLCDGELKNVDITVNKGEIVGISGLAGSGQKYLLNRIFAAAKKKNPKIDLKTNVVYISGDRNNEGVFRLWDIKNNINISSLEQTTSKGLVNKSKANKLAQFWYDKLKFAAQGISDDITSLSGGNQQKALIARGLAADADLILLNDPTCGVDIETKQEIYRLLEDAKDAGKSIILHSTEDLEMEQCDRIYVMHEGAVIAELKGEEISVKNIVTTSFKEVTKQRSEVVKTEEVKQNNLKHAVKRVVTNRVFLPVLTLLLIFAINSSLKPRILSYDGIELLFSSAVPLVFIALGQMFLVISGGIDMGNGMALGLVNVIIAFILLSNPALGVGFLLLFIIAYGAMGALIHVTKIPAIVVTLGASFLWLGIGLIVSPTPGGAAPEWLTAIYRFQFPLIPMPIVISAVAAFGSYWIIKRSKYGMIINGSGNNPAAITRAGWSHLAAMVVIYMIAGVMIVFAGLSVTAVSNGGDTNAYATYQMISIATIILGGCEFKGGIGSPVGVVAGALAISSISALLTFLSVDSNLQSAVTGLILIAALAIKLISRKREA